MHALIFDLDGTLVDTVYAHVLSWQRALAEAGVLVDGYRLHRHVGSSGGLIIRFAARETGLSLSEEQMATVRRRHEEVFREILPRPRPLPGAAEMFMVLRKAQIPFAIATASYRPRIDGSLEAVGIGADDIVVEGRAGLRGKPEPDLFQASRERLGTRGTDCIVVGDAIWDHTGARRAGMLSVGVLAGGYGEEELYHAGAFRVYRTIADCCRIWTSWGSCSRMAGHLSGRCAIRPGNKTATSRLVAAENTSSVRRHGDCKGRSPLGIVDR